MRHIYILTCAALLTACAGQTDEFRLARLSDGGTEIALPYSDGVATLEASGFPVDALVAKRANDLCPDGYSLDYKGMRQRPEYADPEKLWVVTCK